MNPLLSPRYWPSWLAVGLVRLLGLLPFPLLWLLGMGLGRLVGRIALGRRRVARRNLELCLPELSPRERERLVSRHFGYLGVAALTQGLVWGASRRRLARLVQLRDRERFDELRARGQNVIVLLPHFIGLELGGAAFTALVNPGMFMYQRIRDPVIDARMRAGRTRFGSLSVERQDDLRGLVRKIRQGIPFFYLPDQDAGRWRGIFVPFCGVQASTYPMLGRFARLADAVVIPIHARYRPWGQGLEVIFGTPLASFPSGDEVADTTAMNQVIEGLIRTLPAQYFWVHRRFKTRPAGEPPLYPVDRRRARGSDA
ncbi:MAG: lipid A biosynthesis acyltransferase [Chromatiaceae bacterium]|nr:lipid A biosynthesis acyltransferase [Chromatiaceae bacterium]